MRLLDPSLDLALRARLRRFRNRSRDFCRVALRRRGWLSVAKNAETVFSARSAQRLELRSGFGRADGRNQEIGRRCCAARVALRRFTRPVVGLALRARRWRFSQRLRISGVEGAVAIAPGPWRLLSNRSGACCGGVCYLDCMRRFAKYTENGIMRHAIHSGPG